MTDSRVNVLVDPDLVRAVEEAINGGTGPGLRRKTWTLVNHKGGVGKTFCVMALAWVLAVHYGLHVLIVDIDPQANSTRRAGLNAMDTERLPTITDALRMNVEGCARDIVQHVRWADLAEARGSIDILPSRLDLEARAEEAAMADAVDQIFKSVKLSAPGILSTLDPILKRVLGNLGQPRGRLQNVMGGDFLKSYDLVLIDCPPSLGHLTQNAWTASEGVLLCAKADFDSVNGAVRARDTLHRIRSAMGVPHLDVHGVMLTDLPITNRQITERRKFGSVRNAEESIQDLQRNFGDLLWRPFFERKSVLAENVDYGVSPVDQLKTADVNYVTSVLTGWGGKLLEASLG